MATLNALNTFRNIKTKMRAEYHRDANTKYLVLRIQRSGLNKLIDVKSVGKYACDHDDLASDDGRCWDCGIIKPLRHPLTNWALPKVG